MGGGGVTPALMVQREFEIAFYSSLFDYIDIMAFSNIIKNEWLIVLQEAFWTNIHKYNQLLVHTDFRPIQSNL